MMRFLAEVWQPFAPRCYWCGETLSRGEGDYWVHQDGSVYKTTVGPNGRRRDEHGVLPTWGETHAEEEAVTRRIIDEGVEAWSDL